PAPSRNPRPDSPQPVAAPCKIEKNRENPLTDPPPVRSVHLPFVAGWSSLVARQAHNLKVVGSNPTPAPNLKPPETAPGGFCLTAYAIFERAAVRVQPSATRGNFETQKPKKGPKFFEAKSRRVLRPTGAAPEFLPLNINKKDTV